MVKRVQITLEDDMDGTPAASTVTFALEGKTYEIDLSEQNAAKLADALAPYIAVAHKVGRTGRAASRPAKSGGDNRKVREWAMDNGLQVSKRGRIPADVQEAYDRAHN